jgi:hypothetical protein
MNYHDQGSQTPWTRQPNTQHGLTIIGSYLGVRPIASHKRCHAEVVALVAPLPQRPLGRHPPVLRVGASWQLMTKLCVPHQVTKPMYACMHT